MRKHPSKSYGARAKDRAAFWRVSIRTAQKWLSAKPPIPVDDPVAMLRWVAALPSASQRKLTRAFLRRVDELRIEFDRKGTPLVDPDYADFLRTHGEAAPRESSLLADLKLQAAFALFKLQRAQAAGDIGKVKDATETLRYISGVVHDEELRAQKLGREVGDILPRAEAERLARAILYWSLRGADDLLTEISATLAAATASGPIFREEVRQLIEPAVLSARVLAPFTRAAQVRAGHALPAWMITAMREAAASTLEDGAQLFSTLHAQPPPAPESFVAGSGI